jgi:hypothetical protein
MGGIKIPEIKDYGSCDIFYTIPHLQLVCSIYVTTLAVIKSIGIPLPGVQWRKQICVWGRKWNKSVTNSPLFSNSTPQPVINSSCYTNPSTAYLSSLSLIIMIFIHERNKRSPEFYSDIRQWKFQVLPS